MTFALVAASSVLALLLALCWAKEFRLRRALQSLLSRLFSQWKTVDEASELSTVRRDVSDSAGSRRRRVR